MIRVMQNDTASIQSKVDALTRLRDRIETIRDGITRLQNKINSNNGYLGWLYSKGEKHGLSYKI
ncbi:MAG: hypothetical protein K2O73_06340 [Lachnospiraceae bacterium]|nr:hypothetical protein [Lachnospiraceae bacterium]MDE7434679.1 hypothetical protein [Lachnospiraceae bacterium]